MNFIQIFKPSILNFKNDFAGALMLMLFMLLCQVVCKRQSGSLAA